MKNLSTFILSLCFIATSYAQQAPIMVCNPAGTACTPFYTLDDAYNAANTDDYIYLPGGTFQLNIPIKKKIHIVGTGFHSDSSIITGKTIVELSSIQPNGNSMILDSGCNGTSIDGIYINGDIIFLNSNTNNLLIENISIINCNIKSLYGLETCGAPYQWGNSFILKSCIIKNCIVRGDLNFGNIAKFNAFMMAGCNQPVYHKGNNNSVENCIIYNLSLFENSNIKNCIIGGYLGTAKNSQVIGSIFQNITLSSIEYVTFNNCLSFTSTITNNVATNTETNCLFNQTASSTFVNASDIVYNESKDFHIKTTSPAYSPTCSGCSQIGIYGGSTPWKEGAIPSYPHFYYKQINSSTNSSGQLPVNIKVRTEN